MLDLLQYIPGKKQTTPSGWISFNAICCHHRGHKYDRRGRGGIRIQDDMFVYHCFNCNFKCSVRPGTQFSKNTKYLLSWSGLTAEDISRLSFKNWSTGTTDQEPLQVVETIRFELRRLPEYARPIRDTDTEQLAYLHSRGFTIDSYSWHVSDLTDTRDSASVILPYYYHGDIVGFTSRFYDNRKPKYISNQQPGYIFNLDNQSNRWKYLILVEGQFDALSIDACAYLGSNISDRQAKLIAQYNKEVIVVPDHDRAGLEIADRALELGYKVSIPDWQDCKDVNEAVLKWGKLSVIMSIIQAATSSSIKVRLNRGRYL